jgi:hypothetical protein
VHIDSADSLYSIAPQYLARLPLETFIHASMSASVLNLMEKESISKLFNNSVPESHPPSNINQKSTVMLLHVKGLSAKDVHTKLAQVLRPDGAIAYSTITKYIRNNIALQNKPEADERGKNQVF